MKKNPLKYILGILVTSLALWLSFKNLDWKTLKGSFSQVNLLWIIPAVFTILLSVYIVGLRWQLLVKSKTHMKMWDIFRYNIISQYANIIIPARIGELFKAWFAAKKYPVSGSYLLGTIFIEKITETFVFIILLVLAPLMVTFQTQLKGHRLFLIFSVLLIPLTIFLVWKRAAVLRWLTYISKILPGKLRTRVLGFIEKGMEAFSLLKNIKILFWVVFLTLLTLFTQVVTNLILFKAYGFQLSFFKALLLQVILTIGMTLPSVPGKIGIFEYTVLLVLTMFNIEKSAALSYGLMLHVISYLPKIILGFIFIANLHISLKTVPGTVAATDSKTDEREVLSTNKK